MTTDPSLDPQLEDAIHADQIWAVTTLSVREEYGGFVIAVANERVWGKGNTVDEAIADALAQPGCPPRERLGLVILPKLAGY
jgi:hypothetical protein